MQNFLTKKPPLNSNIEVKNELNQTIISWKNPRGNWSRYLIVIFLLAWLGGWATGEYSVAKKVLNGETNPFEIFWLIGWTVGGLFAMANIYFMVRPTKAEKLNFDSYSLQFKPGTPPFAGINRSGNSDEDAKKATFFQKTKSKYIIPKAEIGEIKLERVGERQRLRIDHGVERIEIGRFLQEPEREWIFESLKQWKGSL
jgi:hypothetical protein